MCHLEVIFKEWYFKFHFLAHVTQFPLIEPFKKTCYGPIWMNVNSHKMWSWSSWNLFRIIQNLQIVIFLLSCLLIFYIPLSYLLPTFWSPNPCSPPSFLTTKSLNAISKMPHYYRDHHHQAILNCNFPMGSLASLGGHFHFIPNGMQKNRV